MILLFIIAVILIGIAFIIYKKKQRRRLLTELMESLEEDDEDYDEEPLIPDEILSFHENTKYSTEGLFRKPNSMRRDPFFEENMLRYQQQEANRRIMEEQYIMLHLQNQMNETAQMQAQNQTNQNIQNHISMQNNLFGM